MKKAGGQARRWAEIDALRGIAIVMMLVSNFIYALTMFGVRLDLHSGFLAWFARVTAAAFLLVAGISLTLSYNRLAPAEVCFAKFLRRGLRLLGWAMVVTAATWVAVGRGLVLFGILHLLACSVILAYPLLRYTYLNLLAGILAISAGILLNHYIVTFPWLLPLGLRYHGFYSVDYTPIFPWSGILFLGIFLGQLLCPGGRPRWSWPGALATPGGRLLSLLGRNSLLVYFLHQPLFMSLLWCWRRLGG